MITANTLPKPALFGVVGQDDLGTANRRSDGMLELLSLHSLTFTSTPRSVNS